MALVKKFRLDSISFPNKCVNCGGPFEKERNITAEKGFDLILYKSWVAADVLVPLCKSCYLKRKIAGIVALPLFIILIILFIIFAALLEGIVSGTVILIFVIFPSLYILYFARNKLDPMLDKIFLGVKPLSFYKDSDEVELWFKDGNLACEVEVASLKHANEQTYPHGPISESTEFKTEKNDYLPEKLQGKYENKINKFLKPNGKVSPIRLFLLSFIMFLVSGAAFYYDYFLDWNDSIFIVLPIAVVVSFMLVLLSILVIAVSFFKKKQ